MVGICALAPVVVGGVTYTRLMQVLLAATCRSAAGSTAGSRILLWS